MSNHFCVLHGVCKRNHVRGSVGKAPSARHDLGTAPRFSHFLVHVSTWSRHHEPVGARPPKASASRASTRVILVSHSCVHESRCPFHSHCEKSQCVGVHGVFTRDTTTICERASHSQPEQESDQNEPISTLDLLLKHWQVMQPICHVHHDTASATWFRVAMLVPPHVPSVEFSDCLAVAAVPRKPVCFHISSDLLMLLAPQGCSASATI